MLLIFFAPLLYPSGRAERKRFLPGDAALYVQSPLIRGGYNAGFRHDVVVRVVAMAVSTVMMNWMMVFQVFMSFKSFIISLSLF